MKTYLPRHDEVEKSRKWHVIDADGVTLGRLATRVAMLLRGKHKATFTPHMAMGDRVIITNAAKVRVTGKKATQKLYYRHTGYPGGIKSVTLEEVLRTRPERAIRHAVKGMLPKNSLGRKLIAELKIYRDDLHPHAAQQPEIHTLGRKS